MFHVVNRLILTTIATFLSDCSKRNELLVERVTALIESVDVAELDRKPDPTTWSPAQVMEHMVITNRYYFPAMRASMSGAAKVSGETQVRFSLIGKLIRRMAGPGGNAPAPKMLHPGDVKFSNEMLGKWQAQQVELIALLEQANGLDISRLPVRNPFFRFIRMNLADSIEIMTAHTERHVGQMEERADAAKGAA